MAQKIRLRLRAADWYGIAVAGIIAGIMALFRQLLIVPVATVGMCAAANAPSWCIPRHAVLWMQYEHIFGWAALILGLAAFIWGHRWAGVLAIGIGIAAVVNYNATYGILGAALGLVAWIGLNTGRYKELS